MITGTLKNLWIGIIAISLFAVGCKSLTKAQKGVMIGAAGGGAVGAGVGKAAGNTALGAIIGATVGGVTGGIIGRQMDKQAKELEQIPGAEVKRVGEGINVTFESGVLFGVDQSSISANAEFKIKELAGILNKYPDTYVLIEGHTDNTGSDAHNLQLSEKRAVAVSDFLRSQSIASSRLKTAFYGESQPKSSNDTEANRAKNRRVEFAIYANEQLKEKAQSQATGSK